MEPYLANLVKTNTYDGFTFSKYLEACALLDGDINGEE